MALNLQYKKIEKGTDLVQDEKDSFVKSVRGKLNASPKLWDDLVGLYADDELVGFYILTKNKQIMNLNSLFVYSKHRGKDYGKKMFKDILEEFEKSECEYFRLSSEKKSVDFYLKNGIQRFFCVQKSGTSLVIRRKDGSILDPISEKMYFNNRRGSCQKPKKVYTKEDLSFGCELELSNVLRGSPIPENYGKWEFSECDIINTKGKYKNMCADNTPENTVPYGGEINTIPSKNYVDQVEKIMNIINLFGDEVDTCITSHTHIHVHINGLENDPCAQRNLVRYIYENQDDVIKHCYKYDESKIPNDKRFSKIKRYLKFDGGRKVPEWFVNNALEGIGKSYEDFLYSLMLGSDGKTKINRHQRYYINLQTLRHSKTVEFRCFRGTLKKEEFLSMFDFAQEFILNALNGGKSVKEILKKDYKFPEMQFDIGQAIGWNETKKMIDSGKGKNRTYWEPEESSGAEVHFKEKENADVLEEWL